MHCILNENAAKIYIFLEFRFFLLLEIDLKKWDNLALSMGNEMAEYPVIPGCKIVSMLGEGATAAVYLGIQESLGRKVAVKVLNPSLLERKEIAVRFEREARTAANLSHSNIIQIFDTGRVGDYYYIVMEYLDESLRDRMKRSLGKLPPDSALEIIRTIMRVLDYAHFQGIYHRDIKPENIMFRQDNTLVLVDFGIAKIFEFEDILSRSGSSIGTPSYMSPEQCKAQKEIDGRSDIYSLGVVLYEMLTGKKPYRGASYKEIARQHIEKPVPRLPLDFERYQPLLDKMMAKDREVRLSTAPEFEDLYSTILAEPLTPDAKKVELSPVPEMETPTPLPVEPPAFPTQPETPDLIAEEPDAAPAKPVNKAKTTALGVFLGIITVLSTLWIISLFTGSDYRGQMAGYLTSTSQGVVSAAAQKKEQEYREEYKQALQYFEQGDFRNVELIIEELEKIKKLETKVAALKEKLYEGYLTGAKKYFEEGYLARAKDTLDQAKKIKITAELLKLESDIDAALSKTKQQ